VKTFITSFLSNRFIHHLVGWTLFIILGIAIETSKYGLENAFYQSISSALLISVIIYINLLILVPKFLMIRKYVKYIFWFLFVCLLYAPFFTLLNSYSHELFTENTFEDKEFSINFLISALNLVVIGFISTFLKLSKAYFFEQKRTHDVAKQHMQTELNFLRSQVNPHFLFNTLNNLYSLTLSKSDHAPEVVLKLSEIMRYMLYECNESTVALEKEVNYIRNYISLERLRQSKHVTVDFNLSGDIYGKELPPLLFVPFLENAFKHGVNTKDSFVNIDMQVRERDLDFIVINSASTYKATALVKKNSGIGLENIKRRLNLLYPKKHKLKIENTSNQFKVNLNIKIL